jgi:hypothetical protein
MVDDAIKQYDSPEKLDKEALSKSIFSANISGEKPG